MTLTDKDLAALAYALERLHEPAVVPLVEMPAVLHAFNTIQAERQSRAALAQRIAAAESLGAKPVPKAADAPPPALREVPPANGTAEPPTT